MRVAEAVEERFDARERLAVLEGFGLEGDLAGHEFAVGERELRPGAEDATGGRAGAALQLGFLGIVISMGRVGRNWKKIGKELGASSGTFD